jgi:ankyrin repeat protein
MPATPDNGPDKDAAPPRPTLADQHWRATLRMKKRDEAEADMEGAIASGNLWRFRLLLQLDLDWSRNDRLLRAAVEAGRQDLFEALVEKDSGWTHTASVNSFTETAAQNGHLGFVKLFIEKAGVDVHYYAEQFLRTAADRGHEEVVAYLLSKGADHNAWSGDPLKNAAENGHLGTVKLLVEAGAELDDGGALERAARQGRLAVVEYLLSKGADPQGGDNDALIAACRGGHKDVASLLLEKGAPGNARDGEAFISACEEKAFDTASLLLAHGADINAQQGRALRNAAWRGETEVVRFLLDKGANPNAQQDRETPLGEAVRAGRPAIVLLLMERGADAGALERDTLNAPASDEMQEALAKGGRLARTRQQQVKGAEFFTAFPGDYTIDDLRARRGASGETGLLIAAQTGKFDALLRGAKGGYLMPADLFHPDEGLETVMTALHRHKQLQQFFDPLLWENRSEAVTEAFQNLPDAFQKRVSLDAVRAHINHQTIMKKAKGLQLKPSKPH